VLAKVGSEDFLDRALPTGPAPALSTALQRDLGLCMGAALAPRQTSDVDAFQSAALALDADRFPDGEGAVS